MKPDHEVIVIGAGIMGATIAKALQMQGVDVLVIDSRIPTAGTPASGGHIKWEWTKNLTPHGFDNALRLLSDVWGVVWEEYEQWPGGGKTSVYRVDTDKVVAYRDSSLENKVQSVRPDTNQVLLEKIGWLTAGAVILAAGYQCKGLLMAGIADLVPKQGISFRYRATLEHPVIHQYAPYKQVVCHQQRNGEVWVGDGTALSPQNWTEMREVTAQRRCEDTLKYNIDNAIALKMSETIGVRPYPSRKLPPTDPCIFEQIGPRCWVVTGGAKQSTIAAGWAARRLLDVLT